MSTSKRSTSSNHPYGSLSECARNNQVPCDPKNPSNETNDTQYDIDDQMETNLTSTDSGTRTVQAEVCPRR